MVLGLPFQYESSTYSATTASLLPDELSDHDDEEDEEETFLSPIFEAEDGRRALADGEEGCEDGEDDLSARIDAHEAEFPEPPPLDEGGDSGDDDDEGDGGPSGGAGAVRGAAAPAERPPAKAPPKKTSKTAFTKPKPSGWAAAFPSARAIFVTLSLLATAGVAQRCISLGAEVADPFGCCDAAVEQPRFHEYVAVGGGVNTASVTSVHGRSYDEVRQRADGFATAGGAFIDLLEGLVAASDLDDGDDPPDIILTTWDGFSNDAYYTLCSEIARVSSLRERFERLLPRIATLDLSHLHAKTKCLDAVCAASGSGKRALPGLDTVGRWALENGRAALEQTCSGRDALDFAREDDSWSLRPELVDANQISLIVHVLVARGKGNGGGRVVGRASCLVDCSVFFNYARQLAAFEAARVDDVLPAGYLAGGPDDSAARSQFRPTDPLNAPRGGPSANLKDAVGYGRDDRPVKPALFDDKGNPNDGAVRLIPIPDTALPAPPPPSDLRFWWPRSDVEADVRPLFSLFQPRRAQHHCSGDQCKSPRAGRQREDLVSNGRGDGSSGRSLQLHGRPTCSPSRARPSQKPTYRARACVLPRHSDRDGRLLVCASRRLLELHRHTRPMRCDRRHDEIGSIQADSRHSDFSAARIRGQSNLWRYCRQALQDSGGQ